MVVFGRIINTLLRNTQRDDVTQEGNALLRSMATVVTGTH